MAVLEKPRTPPREVFARLSEGTLAQLIDGEIIMSPAPKTQHQEIVGEIYRRMANFLEAHPLGKVFVSPIDVKLAEDEIYQPDIIFLSNDHLFRVKDWGIEGAPDLVIEVLSASTAQFDLNHKKQVYQNCGVHEYLVVDPVQLTVELFANEVAATGQKQFLTQGLLQQRGTINFKQLAGFTLMLEDIFSRQA